MKAFVGRSFRNEDAGLIRQIVDFIESLNIDCGDAKSAKSRKVEDKIRELISECEIFVGIFTCDEPICKEKKKTKWHCTPRTGNTIYTTSNWVIQESGFAIGKDRKLILLKENGVCDLPKLQGNLEYIPFNRNNMQEPFLKISQMISDMKAQASGGVTEKSSEGQTKTTEIKPEEQKGQFKKETKDKKQESINKIYVALWGDKNYKKAWEIFNEEAEAILDDDEKIEMRALILRVSNSLGDESAFEKLVELAQEKGDRPFVIEQLAHRYKEMREFKKAKEKFLNAAEKYDSSDVDRKGGLVDTYVQAAWCLTEDDDLKNAIPLLKRLLSDPNFQDYKARLFKAMAEMSQEKNDTESFYFYAEASLDINPSDTDLRFALAYAYSQSGYNKLSLLHYKKLTDATINSTAFNNLGAQYGNFKINGKCIECYCKAADYKETLAMANLAQKYLNEGFLNNAQELINRANKLINEGVRPDYRVGYAQKRVNDLKEEEKKKEKNILLDAEKERRFRLNYSKAFCSEITVAKEDIEGTWETPFGTGELKFEEKKKSFSIRVRKEEVEAGNLFYSLYSAEQGTPAPEPKKILKNISIEGTLRGLGGKYSVSISESGKAPTLLTGGSDASGYLILSDDSNRISTMEKAKDDKVEFKEWNKSK